MRHKIVIWVIFVVIGYILSYCLLSLFGSYAERQIVVEYNGFLDAHGILQSEWHIYGTYDDKHYGRRPQSLLIIGYGDKV